ncbi:DUF2268 domain-containing protein [Rhizobium ruizarguesonis]
MTEHIILLDQAAKIRKLDSISLDHRADFFRHSIMSDFRPFWECLRVPFQAKKTGGYDIVMAWKMLGGFDPENSTLQAIAIVEKFADGGAFGKIKASLNLCERKFAEKGFTLSPVPMRVMLLPGNPDSTSLKANLGFTGMGGIPGYMLLISSGSNYTLDRLEYLAAHEFSHQVKLSLEPWRNDISLAEYMVLEGLAEALVRDIYGDGALGPWVTSLDAEELAYSTEVLRGVSHHTGFDQIRGYMFGDALAADFGYERVGLSHAAGYAVGFQLVQTYLRNTGKDALTATLEPMSIIINSLRL